MPYLRKLVLYRNKTRASLRSYGIKHTLRRVLEDALLRHFFLFGRFVVYEKQLTDLGRLCLRNPELEFSFIREDSHEDLRQIEELSGLPRELVSEKLMEGSECLVARKGDQLVGFNLIYFGSADIRCIEKHLTLLESEAWSERIHVSALYIRSGVATDLRHIVFHHLARKGYTKLIGGYEPFNVRSGMLAKRLGFVETQKVTCIRILGWKKYYVQCLFQQSGMKKGASSGPSLSRLCTAAGFLLRLESDHQGNH